MNKVLKRLLFALAALIVIVVLGACGNGHKNAAPKNGTYTVTLTVNKKQISKKHIAVVKKQSILAAMEKHYKVDQDKGFITAINGHKQNAKKNLYWMFYIDGKSAAKGAGDIVAKKGQKISFRLEQAKY
ncbi:DUF4430 domain-containing protein [Lacticaseibacillus hulanensis]|uniref:DUF4430 domain-containing protein n=1 Tax=Lacticaseibacillus hulanensis TaxID=2493111 RepID=UPI000FD72FE5|nr:DUF4430 domain-containing protein [Lacticaseibacillus hulanensis]